MGRICSMHGGMRNSCEILVSNTKPQISIVTRLGLDDQGSIPGRGIRIYSPRHRVQTGSGSRTASYPMGTGGFLPGVKRQGRKADHSPPSSAEVKNT